MPREPRISKLHHEERTGNIHREASSFDSVIDTVNKIIDFIDEQYEKEKNIVGEMDYRTIPCEKHKFERSCDCHVHKSEEKKCICNEFCKNWPKYPVYTWEKCECHCHKEPVSERNEEEVLEKLERSLPEESVSERLVREDRRKLEDVSERNALIDELVKDVDKKCSCSNHVWGCAREIRKDDVIDLLKSKKK